MSFYIPTDEDRKRMHDRIDANLEYDNTIDELTAENAKLREQLAEAVELLSRLNYTFLPPCETAAIDAFVAQQDIHQ